MPKTVIAPCMGVGKIVASVTRRAAYQVQGQCPEDVEILSLPALLAGDEHERRLIQENPSIIIDGCALRCAAHIYKLFGVEPAAKVEVSQIMKENKIGPGKTRKELEETGKRLSAFTADRVLKALTDVMLTEGFAPVDELAQSAPEPGCGCPHRGLAGTQSSGDAAELLTQVPGQQGEAEKEAAELTGVCGSGPEGQQTPDGMYAVKSVTILPCQGIKRSGGRITQRAAYHVVEDKYLGKTNLLCISALAAGVQEDVDMLEKYPTVAINGCGKRCASIAAEHHGIPAVAAVDLHEIDKEYPCESYCLEPDLTDAEAQEALKLAEAVNVEVEKLIGHEIHWKPGRINLHGLVHESSKINALTGFGDPGKGFLVKLARQSFVSSAVVDTQSLKVPTLKSTVTSAPAVGNPDEFPGVQKVVAALFVPKRHRSE